MGPIQGARSIKNTLLKILSPKTQAQPSDHERILIVSTTGLGDTLWATPAIRAIKTARPTSHLAVLTSPIGKQVLQNSPFIDEIITAADPVLPQTWKLINQLRQKLFDTILIFHTSQRLILPICSFAKSKNIIGTTGINKGLDFFLTHPIVPIYEHEIARRLRIVKAIGVETTEAQLDWFVSDAEKLLAKAYLAEFKKPIIGLHPGAKDAFKQWPMDHFIKLGQALSEMDVQILVTGNRAEKPLADAIAKQIPGAKSIAGLLPLRTFAAVLSQFDLFITNDTGPMHMSFALNVKTVALFGPTDPALCGPYHAENCLIFAKSRTCNPCLKKACFAPFCMRQIGTEEVIADVKRFYIGEKVLCH